MVNDRKNLTIAVLHGGFEPERYASTLTGKNVYKALLNAGYKNVCMINVDKNIIIKLKKAKPNFAFLTMFCQWGEDGIIQGLLEVMNIPYSGSGVETSVICKNKYLFTMFTKALGMPVPKIYFYGDAKDFEGSRKKIQYPCIIKPVYQGYSLGVSFVHAQSELDSAIKIAFQFSSKVLIQEFIDGREFTVGVLDIPNKGSIILPIIEVKLIQNPIQNTQVKDNPTLMEEILPAPLTMEQTKKLNKLTLKLYKALGCLGVSRFDVRQNKEGKFYFLENNTCPGILNYQQSDLPKQLRAVNISLEKFVDFMVVAGLKRLPTKLDFACE